MAAKKKLGAKRKPAHSASQAAGPKLVLSSALHSFLNMAVVASVSGIVLLGLLAVKRFAV